MSGVGFNQRPSGNGLGTAAHATEHAALTYKIPYIRAQRAVPSGLAPNGTVATNGAITLVTALPMTYAGGIWLRLPAGAVVGGSAGMYWVVMSSTTVGQVYTNFADPAAEFIPYVPSGTLVAAVGSNAAYTQTIASVISLINVNIFANSLGLHGGVIISARIATPNNANAKSVTFLFGGQTAGISNSVASNAEHGFRVTGMNRGVANRQVWPGFVSDFTAGAVAHITQLVDTTINQPVVLTANISTATDFIVYEQFSVRVLPSS